MTAWGLGKEHEQAHAFWDYMTAQHVPAFGSQSTLTSLDGFLLDDAELRVLSKATSAAGGYLVPSDFGDRTTTARRGRNVIGAIARELVTDDGRALPLPTTTAHGTASWTAENAAVSATDETFGQVSLGAFKAATKVIVSEELAADAIDDFDAYLADELGQRGALLEETAFAVGDGSGKPLGLVTSGNGVSTVTAATAPRRASSSPTCVACGTRSRSPIDRPRPGR
jgi:HK97 family phage major capsid protein